MASGAMASGGAEAVRAQLVSLLELYLGKDTVRLALEKEPGLPAATAEAPQAGASQAASSTTNGTAGRLGVGAGGNGGGTLAWAETGAASTPAPAVPPPFATPARGPPGEAASGWGHSNGDAFTEGALVPTPGAGTWRSGREIVAAREGHTLGSEGGALEWGGASASASLGFPFPWGSLEPTTPELPPHHSEFPADLAYLCASLSVKEREEILPRVCEPLVAWLLILCCTQSFQSRFLLESLGDLAASGAIRWRSFIPRLLKCLGSSFHVSLPPVRKGSDATAPGAKGAASQASQAGAAAAAAAVAGRGTSSGPGADQSGNSQGSAGQGGAPERVREAVCTVLLRAVEAGDLDPASCAQTMHILLGWLEEEVLKETGEEEEEQVGASEEEEEEVDEEEEEGEAEEVGGEEAEDEERTVAGEGRADEDVEEPGEGREESQERGQEEEQERGRGRDTVGEEKGAEQALGTGEDEGNGDKREAAGVAEPAKEDHTVTEQANPSEEKEAEGMEVDTVTATDGTGPPEKGAVGGALETEAGAPKADEEQTYADEGEGISRPGNDQNPKDVRIHAARASAPLWTASLGVPGSQSASALPQRVTPPKDRFLIGGFLALASNACITPRTPQNPEKAHPAQSTPASLAGGTAGAGNDRQNGAEAWGSAEEEDLAAPEPIDPIEPSPGWLQVYPETTPVPPLLPSPPSLTLASDTALDPGAARGVPLERRWMVQAVRLLGILLLGPASAAGAPSGRAAPGAGSAGEGVVEQQLGMLPPYYFISYASTSERWVWRILAPLALHKRVKKSRGRKRKGGKHQRGRAKRARRGEGEDAVFGTPEGAPETAGSAEGEPADPGVDAGEHTWGSDAATGSERQLVALGPSAPGTSISKAGRGGRVGGEVRRGIQELVRGTMAWRLRGLSAYLGIVGEAAHCPLLACSPRPPPVPFFYRTALGEPLLGQEAAEAVDVRSHDWLRALRCLRVAMRCNPNADWWRKALVLAPCFRVAAAAAAAAAAATAGQQGRQGAAPAAAGAKLGPAAAAAAAAAAGSAQLSGINPTQQQPQEPPNAPASSQSLAPSSAPGGAPGAGGAGAGAGGGGKAGGSGLTPLPFLSSSQAYAVPQFSSAMLCEALVDYVMELMEAHAHSKAPGPAPAPQQGAADAAAAAASGAADAPATSPLGSAGSKGPALGRGDSFRGSGREGTGGRQQLYTGGTWQQWLSLADLFYYVMRNGFVDFVDFVTRCSKRCAAKLPGPSAGSGRSNQGAKDAPAGSASTGPSGAAAGAGAGSKDAGAKQNGRSLGPQSNHITWLLAQVFRLDTVHSSLKNDPDMLGTVRRIVAFHVVNQRPAGSTVGSASVLGGRLESAGPANSSSSTVTEAAGPASGKEGAPAGASAGAGAGGEGAGGDEGAAGGAESEAESVQSVAQGVLLDFVGSVQILRLWSLHNSIKDALDEGRLAEYKSQGKVLEDCWKRIVKGELQLDYGNLDGRSMGIVWVLSHTMSNPVTEAIVKWLRAPGSREIVGGPKLANGTPMRILNETRPLPMGFLQGLSLQVAQRLATALQDLIAQAPQVGELPSEAMLETYARLLLAAPQSLSQSQTIHPPLSTSQRHLLQAALDTYNPGESPTTAPLMLLELINYRLIPFFRFHGKLRGMILDVAKLLIRTRLVAPGQHRLFRLAENTALNLIGSLREVMLVKRQRKAPTDLSETLNRVMVVNLAVTVKTRGIAEMQQMLLLEHALEQMMAASPHRWSEKTMRYFPPQVREVLTRRPDRRAQIIQDWQQVEQMMRQRQLLPPAQHKGGAMSSALAPAPAAVLPFLRQLMTNAQHRTYVCSAAWALQDAHPGIVDLSQLAQVVREFSPEDVTRNIYSLVDVLLHHVQVQLSQQRNLKQVVPGVSAALAEWIFVKEVLPFDIVLLALADRDDVSASLRLVVGLLMDRQELQTRAHNFCTAQGQQEHWVDSPPGTPLKPRPDALASLGPNLMADDRNPVYFDHIVLRAVPIIPMIVQRLIENDAMETADRLLALYTSEPCNLLQYHPSRFAIVRDTLAYFYPTLQRDKPSLIVRLLSTLDLSKTPFSEEFLTRMGDTQTAGQLPRKPYFLNLLAGLAATLLLPLPTHPLLPGGIPVLLPEEPQGLGMQEGEGATAETTPAPAPASDPAPAPDTAPGTAPAEATEVTAAAEAKSGEGQEGTPEGTAEEAKEPKAEGAPKEGDGPKNDSQPPKEGEEGDGHESGGEAAQEDGEGEGEGKPQEEPAEETKGSEEVAQSTGQPSAEAEAKAEAEAEAEPCAPDPVLEVPLTLLHWPSAPPSSQGGVEGAKEGEQAKVGGEGEKKGEEEGQGEGQGAEEAEGEPDLDWPSVLSAGAGAPLYEHLDTGGYAQLVLETAVLEILSQPVPKATTAPTQLVETLVAAALHYPLRILAAAQAQYRARRGVHAPAAEKVMGGVVAQEAKEQGGAGGDEAMEDAAPDTDGTVQEAGAKEVSGPGGNGNQTRADTRGEGDGPGAGAGAIGADEMHGDADGAPRENQGGAQVALEVPPKAAAVAPLMLQACGVLLAQLPLAFHSAFFSLAAQRIVALHQALGPSAFGVLVDDLQCQTLHSAFSSLLPCALPTPIASPRQPKDPPAPAELPFCLKSELALLVSLTHSMLASLPFDRLDNAHALLTLQRPVQSVAHLRVLLRTLAPLVPRITISRAANLPLFSKTLGLFFGALGDVFGATSDPAVTGGPNAISDIVDFFHHMVLMEGGTATECAYRKPHPDTLLLCSKELTRCRPDIQAAFRHLGTDAAVSVYAALHQNSQPASS